MNLETIAKQISDKKWPPVDQWNPDFCGDIDIVIKANGDWFYQGTIISRPKMVSLFASVLKKEADKYFLVTPVEKVGITVEDTPFVVVGADFVDDAWVLMNNLNETAILSSEHPLIFDESGSPQVIWRAGMPARLNQNVFYQLQLHALDSEESNENQVWLHSNGEKFLIGTLVV